MNSLLLASTFLPGAPTSHHVPDAYAELYAGPHTGLKDTLRITAVLAAILAYTGLLALIA